MKKKILFAILFLLVCIGIGFLSLRIECKLENEWMCSICGSTKEQIAWFHGIKPDPVIQNSPFDTWLQQKGIEHSHDWTLIKGEGKNLLGMETSCGYGPSPAIMNFPKDSMARFLQQNTEEEILALYEIMEAESEEEKQTAINDLIHSVSDR